MIIAVTCRTKSGAELGDQGAERPGGLPVARDLDLRQVGQSAASMAAKLRSTMVRPRLP